MCQKAAENRELSSIIGLWVTGFELRSAELEPRDLETDDR